MARKATLPAVLPGDVRLMNATAAIFAALGLVALAAVLLAWLAKQPAFNLRSIRIDGDVTRNSIATIRANAMPHLAGNYFSLDLGAARAAFEAVPWVRHAVVNRVFPDRLAVRLEEHRAAALWSTETGDDKLVNTHGEVFEANPGDVEDETLPTLQGPDGMQNWLRMFGGHFLQRVPESRQADFFAQVEAQLRPRLFRDEQWSADYRRLQVVAWKTAGGV